MEDKKNKISRRQFVRNLGTGVVGATAVVTGISAMEARPDIKPPEITPEFLTSVSLTVNGKPVKISVSPAMTLAELLREKLNLTGTKITCNNGECGACTVVLNGRAVYSCHTLAVDADGGEIITIEGLLNGEELHPIQHAFVEKDGYQCGFCTPGQIMSAYALLLSNPDPTDEEIMTEMSGNLCRCGAYPKILHSVKTAALKVKQTKRG